MSLFKKSKPTPAPVVEQMPRWSIEITPLSDMYVTDEDKWQYKVSEWSCSFGEYRYDYRTSGYAPTSEDALRQAREYCDGFKTFTYDEETLVQRT